MLVKSACPSIYGNDIVKAGLILSLFGGTDYWLKAKGNDFGDIGMQDGDEDENDDYNAVMRPDIHLLMIGDPGLGKSQMLKHIINIAPRGVYVCGSSTTNAGLTATLVWDSGTGE